MTDGDFEFWTQQKQAFNRAFMPVDGPLMKDFIRFCRWKATIASPEPNLIYMMEGRRQVLIRVFQHLELDVEALAVLYPDMEAYYG